MPNNDPELRPVCFMVMPFRRKKVGEPKGDDAPAELDCDALWDKAFRPAIEDLGYVPIRADYDAGSVIVKDMLERLALADLVLADVSLPNGNVYYEVGLRHVAKESNCVLLAAEWSRQLFDIDQFTSLRYPLKDGNVSDAEATEIRRRIMESVPVLKDSKTPYHEFITGEVDDLARKGVFCDHAQRLSDFQAGVREVRLIEDPGRRKARVVELRSDVPEAALDISEVAIELLCLVRDEIGWKESLEFIESLPPTIRELPFMREQYLLALGNQGKPEEAIAKLIELVAKFGDSGERQGLIGGRYKRLWRGARDERVKEGKDRPSIAEKRYLEKAIQHYTHGMELDYNEYYCSCNLPQLLRARGKSGDEARARIIDHFVVAACERALARNEGDDWVRPTLLGAAFRAADVEKANELAERIHIEGVAGWKLDSTLADLSDAVRRIDDPGIRESLQEVHDDLEALLGNSSG